MNKSISKKIGYVTKKVAEELNLPDQIWKPIKITPALFEHIAKHSEEYKNAGSCLYTLENLSNIVDEPNYVFYNKRNKSIEYYKFLQEYVSLIVKVTNKKNLYVASVYPVKKIKIENRLEKKKLEQNKQLEDELDQETIK